MSSRKPLLFSDNLEPTEAISAASAGNPRVTLEDVKENIAHVAYMTAGAALAATNPTAERPGALDRLTLCFLTASNGFTIVGQSACASPENFDAEMGRTYAYQDAERQLWTLMGYALRDRIEIAQDLCWLIADRT